MHEQLSIGIICANTAAAKGRVQRAHGTLQDRLVKEMRLEGSSSISDANAWIDGFVETYNARFSKPPGLPINLHRPLMDFEDLDDTFQRSLFASLTLQYDKVLYLVDPSRKNHKLAGKRVTVIDYPDGRLTQTHQGEVVSHKRLVAVLTMLGRNRSYCRKRSAAFVALLVATCPGPTHLGK